MYGTRSLGKSVNGHLCRWVPCLLFCPLPLKLLPDVDQGLLLSVSFLYPLDYLLASSPFAMNPLESAYSMHELAEKNSISFNRQTTNCSFPSLGEDLVAPAPASSPSTSPAGVQVPSPADAALSLSVCLSLSHPVPFPVPSPSSPIPSPVLFPVNLVLFPDLCPAYSPSVHALPVHTLPVMLYFFMLIIWPASINSGPHLHSKSPSWAK